MKTSQERMNIDNTMIVTYILKSNVVSDHDASNCLATKFKSTQINERWVRIDDQ